MSDSKNNTGIENSGHYNSGYRNSGRYNSGDCNNGNYNSGYYNSGDRNSGNYNSGSYNSGSYNSGSYNSGHRNSGRYNSGNHNSGFFNTDEPTVRMFNKDTGLKRSEINIPYIYLPITKWDSDKQELVTQSYEEAWALTWKELDDETKQKFLDLPNFDAEIFKEITGIDVGKQESCEGKVIEIDGEQYKLVKV